MLDLLLKIRILQQEDVEKTNVEETALVPNHCIIATCNYKIQNCIVTYENRDFLCFRNLQLFYSSTTIMIMKKSTYCCTNYLIKMAQPFLSKIFSSHEIND